jgi:hypothetical protein
VVHGADSGIWRLEFQTNLSGRLTRSDSGILGATAHDAWRVPARLMRDIALNNMHVPKV